MVASNRRMLGRVASKDRAAGPRKVSDRTMNSTKLSDPSTLINTTKTLSCQPTGTSRRKGSG